VARRGQNAASEAVAERTQAGDGEPRTMHPGKQTRGRVTRRFLYFYGSGIPLDDQYLPSLSFSGCLCLLSWFCQRPAERYGDWHTVSANAVIRSLSLTSYLTALDTCQTDSACSRIHLITRLLPMLFKCFIKCWNNSWTTYPCKFLRKNTTNSHTKKWKWNLLIRLIIILWAVQFVNFVVVTYFHILD
jgi:hypothetical protein